MKSTFDSDSLHVPQAEATDEVDSTDDVSKWGAVYDEMYSVTKDSLAITPTLTLTNILTITLALILLLIATKHLYAHPYPRQGQRGG